jgi:hypothetical protein
VQHLSLVLSPSVLGGLTPFYTEFYLKESSPVPSVLAEGEVYRHPQRHEEAVVWAVNDNHVFEVLTYHFGNEWYGARVMGMAHMRDL